MTEKVFLEIRDRADKVYRRVKRQNGIGVLRNKIQDG